MSGPSTAGPEHAECSEGAGCRTVAVGVGGITVRMRGLSEERRQVWESPEGFLAEGDTFDIDLLVEEQTVVDLPPRAALVFDARPLWTMHRAGPHLLLSIWDGTEIEQQAQLTADGRQGRLLIRADRPGHPGEGLRVGYPLLLLLYAWRVAREEGLLLHACGVAWRKAGLAFCGRSSAGKTTTSRLWSAAGSSTVLNDDRVIARPGGDGYRLMGTPWHGEARLLADQSADLRALLCIRHGQANRLLPLSGARAAAEIYACGVLPFYDPEAMERAYETCARLAGTVPVWTYEFVPDRSAVEFIQQFLIGEGLVEG